MSANSNSGCTVYIGNLDERVSDRVLYDILIQAGKVIDLYVPRDRETDKPKGYAFAEYETEENADYAVKLFSGLVTLYNRTLKFAISGQDKASQRVSSGALPASSASIKSRLGPAPFNSTEVSHHSMRLSTSFRDSSNPSYYSEEPPPPGVTNNSNGYGSRVNGPNYEFSRRALGSTLDSISRSKSRR